MQAVKEWSVGMCAAAIAVAVVKVLTPLGSLEKCVKTVVSVFLLCAMILPFCGKNAASQRYMPTNFDESELTEQALNDEISRQTAQYLKNSIEKILDKNGISYGDVVIDMELKDGTVSVGKITVINPDTDVQTVQTIIRNELGAEVSVEEK